MKNEMFLSKPRAYSCIYWHKKLYQNLYIKWAIHNFEHQSRAITLYLNDKIYSSAIPKHTLPISTVIQSFE